MKTVINRADNIIKEDDYHPSLKFFIEKTDIKFLNSKKTQKFNFFKANYDNINNDLSSIDWSHELNSPDINQAVDTFYSIIHDIISSHVPLIKPRSDKYPKWFSYSLIKLIETKEYYRNHMNGPKKDLFTKLFAEKRKEIKHEKKICLKKYENHIEDLIPKNTKSFFAFTKAHKQSNKLPITMFYKDTHSDNLKLTSDLFSKYFSSVY